VTGSREAKGNREEARAIMGHFWQIMHKINVTALGSTLLEILFCDSILDYIYIYIFTEIIFKHSF